MTRTELAAAKVAREKAKLAVQAQKAKAAVTEQKKAVAVAEGQVREATRRALHKRRYRVGALADEAGLFGYSDAELAGMFAALATLPPCAFAAEGPGLLAVSLAARAGGHAWAAQDA
jgi:hypothetical protein